MYKNFCSEAEKGALFIALEYVRMLVCVCVCNFSIDDFFRL